MAQAIQQETPMEVVQRTLRVVGILTACVAVVGALYVATLYLIAG